MVAAACRAYSIRSVQQTLVGKSGSTYRTVLTLDNGAAVTVEGSSVEASFGTALAELRQAWPRS